MGFQTLGVGSVEVESGEDKQNFGPFPFSGPDLLRLNMQPGQGPSYFAVTLTY